MSLIFDAYSNRDLHHVNQILSTYPKNTDIQYVLSDLLRVIQAKENEMEKHLEKSVQEKTNVKQCIHCGTSMKVNPIRTDNEDYFLWSCEKCRYSELVEM